MRCEAGRCKIPKLVDVPKRVDVKHVPNHLFHQQLLCHDWLQCNATAIFHPYQILPPRRMQTNCKIATTIRPKFNGSDLSFPF